MKKIFLSMILLLNLSAQNLEIDKLRTDLYSKSGTNILKKIEISLEFQGDDLQENKNKLIDSINTVISGFFYEDIFTEIGKNNFKKTLEKFVDKKYKIKLNDIYILSLSGIEKFDLEEFKRFLQSTQAQEENIGEEVKQTLQDLEPPKTQDLEDLNASKSIEELFKDMPKQEQNDEQININRLNIPKITQENNQQNLINNLFEILNQNDINHFNNPSQNFYGLTPENMMQN
ncbi:hypothetical protein N4T57_04305 [Campylobacter hepaticus]|uniref:Flagellar protein FliL n=1 Tax=Campylobacter hepaticus TaxID=1813019 RepID=A0A424Z079_9BACT|nr:hypothetical protein [Campylobacter hepaticus]AXP08537.1 hypothetical protein A2J15_002145 [Campylobacter hepaticus]MCZ0772376.1 hypothetical protein [Campylobacter hepaticus]MCZ0773844.1 hypothetical protein [Campylobacter hepaticus]MCZ0775095.1 hypothetical protein [Campylobacter hepaticus]MDX2330488.1 hypothetical protein [Campylobacter hepaticus]